MDSLREQLLQESLFVSIDIPSKVVKVVFDSPLAVQSKPPFKGCGQLQFLDRS